MWYFVIILLKGIKVVKRSPFGTWYLLQEIV